jgi:hypothetical protein
VGAVRRDHRTTACMRRGTRAHDAGRWAYSKYAEKNASQDHLVKSSASTNYRLPVPGFRLQKRVVEHDWKAGCSLSAPKMNEQFDEDEAGLGFLLYLFRTPLIKGV